MRFYRALLVLYPKAFRDDYSRELLGDFALRSRGSSGPLAGAALWLSAFTDVLRNAAAAHLDILAQDLRYALRAARRAPGVPLTAILVTAIGVGANTAAFTVADYVLARPLPYPQPGRLVKLWQRMEAYQMEPSPANYDDWKKRSTSFESMAAYNTASVNVVGQGEPVRLEFTGVMGDLKSVLGVQPALGRSFTPDDEKDSAPAVVILSHGFWQSRFGEDVLGKTISLDGIPHVVVGVMPRDFAFPRPSIQLWRPLRIDADDRADRGNNFLQVVARLKQGVPLEKARAEMDVIAAALQKQYPKENEGVGVTVGPLRADFSSQSRLLLLALTGAAACVLLIACANLANLLLSRALERRGELAVRAALGAGRERLVRQLVTEGLLLALAGGACGILVAHAAIPLLARLVPDSLPFAQAPSVDLRVLVFATLVTGLTGIAFAVFPARSASKTDDASALHDGARDGGGLKQRARSALVLAEVTATVVLLISAGLLLRALWRVRSTEPGFRAEGVLTMRTALPWPKYELTATRERFYNRVLDGVRALPGVSGAAYISFLPMAMGGGIWPVGVDGEPGPVSSKNMASLRFATPGIFSALGIPLLRGRGLEETDRAGAPEVAVVSESFVKRHWPGLDPIGRKFQMARGTLTVVGVAGDIRVRGPERSSEPQVYLSYRQQPDRALIFYPPKDLVVRASGDLAPLAPAILRIVRDADPDQPVSNVKTMTEIVGDQTASRSAQVRILGAFAAVAFVLAGVGIHGVLAHAVASRKREIGVRLALGAEPRDIVRMVMRQAVRLSAAGLIPGALIAYAAGRAMQGLLAGVQPADAPTFATAIALCAAMTLLGSAVPVLRAARVSPTLLIKGD